MCVCPERIAEYCISFYVWRSVKTGMFSKSLLLSLSAGWCDKTPMSVVNSNWLRQCFVVVGSMSCASSRDARIPNWRDSLSCAPISHDIAILSLRYPYSAGPWCTIKTYHKKCTIKTYSFDLFSEVPCGTTPASSCCPHNPHQIWWRVRFEDLWKEVKRVRFDGAFSLKTLTSLNKEVRPFCLSDNSIWSFPSVSYLSDYSIWRSWRLFCPCDHSIWSIWAHCPRFLLSLRKNGQEESGLLNLRRLRSSRFLWYVLMVHQGPANISHETFSGRLATQLPKMLGKSKRGLSKRGLSPKGAN